MSIAANQLMEADEFLLWCLNQDGRFELVDGVPVQIDLMAGASGTHDCIVNNLIISLGTQLADQPCRTTTADTALRTRIRTVRRPDMMVTCDPPRGDVFEALQPRLAVEVLSKSNVGVPWARKLDEYRRHKVLDYILLIDSTLVAVTLYERTAGGWEPTNADRMADAIELPKIGCRLSLFEIYKRTGLNESPLLESDLTVPAS